MYTLRPVPQKQKESLNIHSGGSGVSISDLEHNKKLKFMYVTLLIHKITKKGETGMEWAEGGVVHLKLQLNY